MANQHQYLREFDTQICTVVTLLSIQIGNLGPPPRETARGNAVAMAEWGRFRVSGTPQSFTMLLQLDANEQNDWCGLREVVRNEKTIYSWRRIFRKRKSFRWTFVRSHPTPLNWAVPILLTFGNCRSQGPIHPRSCHPRNSSSMTRQHTRTLSHVKTSSPCRPRVSVRESMSTSAVWSGRISTHKPRLASLGCRWSSPAWCSSTSGTI